MRFINRTSHYKVFSTFGVAIALTGFSLSAMGAEPTDTIGDIYSELDELVITAKKEIIKSDGAQLTYDLDQDDSSKGQSLLDALRKVPLITIDGDDNIYIKGSQNFRIYVNGKEEPMLAANYQKIFKAMPAESVSKIEVITEPGAKYDAEGTGGILNLVTERKQSKDGYTANLSMTGAVQQSQVSAYGRLKKNRITADANVNYATNQYSTIDSKQNLTTINKDSEAEYLQKSNIDQRFDFQYLGAMLNLSWEPTDKDLFSFGMNTNWMDAGLKSINTVNSMYNRAGILQWQTMQLGTGGIGNTNASGNASYRHLFGNDGKALTTAYRFSFGHNNTQFNYQNDLMAGNYPVMPHEQISSDTYDREHTATIDYENPFDDGKHKLEIGAKGIFRRNSAINSHNIGMDANSMQNISDHKEGILQIQDVYAAYAAYKGSFGNFSLTGGLRYEHTYMGIDFHDAGMQNFRTHLNDLTPNTALSYMFGPACNLRLAYQMRISRPGVSQLNPAPLTVTQTFVMVGNPDLESERSNSVSLTYSNFTPKIGGNVSLSYTLNNNAIESISYFEDAISYQTYANVGRKNRIDLTAFLNWNINDKMSASVNGSVNYTDINAPQRGLRNSGWKGDYGANWNYTGPWRLKFTVFGGQSTGFISLQSEANGWYYYGMSIHKSFLKNDALSVTLNANNFLAKYTHFNTTTVADNYTMHTHGCNRSWNVGITISWKFGHLQETVKHTDARLDNDDINQTQGGGVSIGK